MEGMESVMVDGQIVAFEKRVRTACMPDNGVS